MARVRVRKSPRKPCRTLGEEEIRANVIINARGCWEWQGKLTAKGYPYHSSWSNLIHRTSYRIFKGEIPEGLMLDHRCRNKACVNPDHLFAVTVGMNNQLSWIENHKQMPWTWLRIARHLHGLVGESMDLEI